MVTRYEWCLREQLYTKGHMDMIAHNPHSDMTRNFTYNTNETENNYILNSEKKIYNWNPCLSKYKVCTHNNCVLHSSKLQKASELVSSSIKWKKKNLPAKLIWGLQTIHITSFTHILGHNGLLKDILSTITLTYSKRIFSSK